MVNTILPTSGKKARVLSEKGKLFIILCLGFSSGLPFLLLLSTFSVWLTEAGMTKTQIGTFAWATIPYTFKFLLAPMVDNLKLPILYNNLGQRRSWMFISQVALAVLLAMLAQLDPHQNIYLLAITAFLVGFFSALQDIVIEAYRIEILTRSHIGTGTSISVLGYRLGMLCSGAGAIYIAAYFNSWEISYTVMAFFMLVGIFATLFAIEPEEKFTILPLKYSTSKWKRVVVVPIKSFARNNRLPIIIGFILCYKFADTVLNVMSVPFLLEIGFNKLEIAYVAKTFGIIAMLCGGGIGCIFLRYYSLWNLLIFASCLQFFAACFFVAQAKIGYNLSLLFFTMGIENFTCGFAQVALLTYLSTLCMRPYTAMHYALLTSFASFVRVNFSMLAGWLADNLLWADFYLLVSFSCIFTIVMLQYYAKHFVAHKNVTINTNSMTFPQEKAI